MFLVFYGVICSSWYFCNYGANAQTSVGMVLEKCYFCENLPNPEVKIYITPKNFDPMKQIYDISFLSPVPIGNDIRYAFSVALETNILGVKRWQPLFGFEDDFCRFCHTYLGDFVYDIEIALAIPPKSCPVPRGKYHAVNYTSDYSKMRMQFPHGRILVTSAFIRKTDKKPLLCFKLIVTNQPETPS